MRRNAAHSPDAIAPAGPPRASSTLINRNVTVGGRRTSIRLEPVMWEALQHVCRRESTSINALVTDIDRQRVESSLTASIRVFLLRYFRAATTDEGHRLAGHGAPPVRQLPL